MTTGRINQVAVVLEVRPGEVLRSPGTLLPQTSLDGSAVLRQPDNRQLCPSGDNISTLCEAWQLFARRAKPTLTLYSVADCVANLARSVRQSRWCGDSRQARRATSDEAGARERDETVRAAQLQSRQASRFPPAPALQSQRTRLSKIKREREREGLRRSSSKQRDRPVPASIRSASTPLKQ